MGFLISCTVPAHTQNCPQDSLRRTLPLRLAADGTHDLRLREVLIPAAAVGVSALFVRGGWPSAQRDNVQELLSAGGKRKIKIDDYSQFAPMAAVYGLNLCGLKGRHAFKERTVILAMSYATTGLLVQGMKIAFRERRPDTDACNSFPSGHTATAFAGAEFLYKEYREVSPWIGYAGYAVAAATGYLRIYNNRHYLNDVVAGACIGIASVKFAYWLYPKCFRHAQCGRATFAGMPCCSADGYWGMNLCVAF